MPPTAVIHRLQSNRLIHRPRNAAQYKANTKPGKTQCVSAWDCRARNNSGQPASAIKSQRKLRCGELLQTVRKTSASRNPIRKNCRYARIESANLGWGDQKVCAASVAKVSPIRTDRRSHGSRIAKTSVKSGTSR